MEHNIDHCHVCVLCVFAYTENCIARVLYSNKAYNYNNVLQCIHFNGHDLLTLS